MGTPMAGHLRAAGHALFVATRSQVPQALLNAGAVRCANAREVAAAADIVFLMVPDTPDVQAVLFGENGVAAGLKDSACGPDGRVGKLVVDMSSISPMATKDFAGKINALGCDYLDAPVSGGEAGADPAKVRQALMGGFASSRILEVHGERMIKRTVNPAVASGCTRKT